MSWPPKNAELAWGHLVLFAAIAKGAGVARPYQRAAQVMRHHGADVVDSRTAQAIVRELRTA